MGLKVSPDDVNRITQRTEGWIAGLQMAALSMQNVSDISGFIAAFTGSHHYIFDYLLEEILGHQSAGNSSLPASYLHPRPVNRSPMRFPSRN